jgi:hypothetical protein
MKNGSFRLWALFPGEPELVAAIRKLTSEGTRLEEIYAPYPIPGGMETTGQQRTRLPWICFGLGLMGAAFKIWFQFWTSSYDWPLNVGGKPWDSLPAFVPVTFEVMVLVAGLGAFAAFLGRRRLYPGKRTPNPYPETSDDSFALRIDMTKGNGDLSRTLEILHASGALRIDRESEGGTR